MCVKSTGSAIGYGLDMSIQAEQDYDITQVATFLGQAIAFALAVLAVDFYLYLLDCASDPQTNSLWYRLSAIWKNVLVMHKLTVSATRSPRIMGYSQ